MLFTEALRCSGCTNLRIQGLPLSSKCFPRSNMGSVLKRRPQLVGNMRRYRYHCKAAYLNRSEKGTETPVSLAPLFARSCVICKPRNTTSRWLQLCPLHSYKEQLRREEIRRCYIIFFMYEHGYGIMIEISCTNGLLVSR